MKTQPYGLRSYLAPSLFLLMLLSGLPARAQELCTPELLVPEQDAVMDNGCNMSVDSLIWHFDWKDCPGATRYHLFVKGSAAKFSLVDDANLRASEYLIEGISYIVDRNVLEWVWEVRALVGLEWSDWSEVRTFDVEPLNTDCMVTALDALDLQKGWLYPNPAEDLIQFALDDVDLLRSIKVSAISLDGRERLLPITFDSASSIVSADVRMLAEGLYIVQVSGGDDVQSAKILIAR